MVTKNFKIASAGLAHLIADFCNKIGTKRTIGALRHYRTEIAA
jgi:hypothetical protein